MGGRDHGGRASWPNIGLEPTPYSVRYASASRRGSGPAFGSAWRVWGGRRALEAPGSRHRRCQGRRPSCRHSLMFPPRAVAWLTGVGCTAPPPPHAFARPWRRAGDPRGACMAPGPGALVRAQPGLARRIRRWCGLVRRPRGVCSVVAPSGGGSAGCGSRPPVQDPSDGLPSHRRGVGGCPRRQEPVWRCRREPAVYGWRWAGAGARRWGLCHVRRQCLVWRHSAGVSHVRRKQGAREARRCGERPASRPCVGGRGTVPTGSRLSKHVARVRRGGTMRVPWGVPQEASRGQSGRGRSEVGGTAGPNNALEPTAPMTACASSSSAVARRLTAGVRLRETNMERRSRCQTFRAYGIDIAEPSEKLRRPVRKQRLTGIPAEFMEGEPG